MFFFCKQMTSYELRISDWSSDVCSSDLLDPSMPFVTESDAGYLPSDKVALICTGSQGEPRSALSRIARDEHSHIVLEEGDTVIFSAREIPGNEKAISRVQSQLIRLGVNIITPDDEMEIGRAHV